MPKGRSYEISIEGLEALGKALAKLGERGPRELGGAMWREATSIINSAKGITPVDTGTLRGSGHVQIPEVTEAGVSVVMGFGGAASNYAIYVHENLSSYHRPPTQAKFLERPFLAAAQGMAQRLAGDLKNRMFA